MAPAISPQDSRAPLTHKIRKPLVEKLRRERINGSIEQLKSLLAPEFLRQRPDSKMEKADVLEMSVCVLRRLQSVRRGYAKCAREAPRLLSQEERLGLLGSSREDKMREEDSSPLGKEDSSAKSGPWRPW